ncbi:calcium-binding protein [Jannaschia aquimarina]|uniref:HlyA_7 protein n=1 Tax=Jannaschia aquimarina TaxID=935700 RepID=A0A0D1EFG0_9RHOB|nr:calcium-binding protein [Jannaschia aquimarina]KIT14635.1 Hemolysin, chromosomal [Jannaschia aquimarina]SNT37491.1 Hemolysin-type calcium-binding repeat-containing protein [Jannaschia aquimarina]
MVRRVLDFDFRPGRIINREYEDIGVRIAAKKTGSTEKHSGMTFDTENPIKDREFDFSGQGFGSVMMISADRDRDEPNIAAAGGKMKFRFDEPVDLTSITLLGATEQVKFKAYDAEGNKIGVVRMDGGEVGQARNVDLSAFDGVERLIIVVKGEAAVDNLVFEDSPVVGGDELSCADGDASQSTLTPGQTYSDLLGDSEIQGTNGQDTVIGNGGDDTIFGNGGDDEILGNAGNDFICGGHSADKLNGGVDNDTLLGDLGDDTLSGDKGSDIVTGGAGADTFVFNPGVLEEGDLDIITDFSTAEGDVFRMDRFNEADISVQAAGLDTEMLFKGEVFAVVQNTNAAEVENALIFT